MRIEEALNQVRVMQSQVARTQHDCCYRSATIAASGFGAIGAAIAQSYWIPDPMAELHRFLFLWIGVAALSVTVTGTEVAVRWLQTDSPHARHRTVATVRQFVPSVMVGGVFTWAVMAFSPEHAVLLPAIWAMFFSLGIFASSEYLPANSLLVAAFYMATGLVCLRWGQGQQALAPWTMTITFGAGQLLTAIVLYRREAAPCDSA